MRFIAATFAGCLLAASAMAQLPGPGLGGNSFVVKLGPITQRVGTDAKSNLQSGFLGTNAGAAYSLATDSGYGAWGFGANSLASLTANNSENTAFGNWTLPFDTTGGLNAAFGTHSSGQVTVQSNNATFGNDSCSDCVPAGGLTAVGQGATHDGAPGIGFVALGNQAGFGNAGAILLTGSVTTGDVITVGGTTSVSGVVGFPFSATYTVLSSDTLATIATAIAGLINTGGLSAPGRLLGASTGITPDSIPFVTILAPGTQTTGAAITWTVSSNGTETFTIEPGDAPTNTIAIGPQSLFGAVLLSPTGNITIGGDAGYSIRSCNDDFLAGYQVGQSLTTCSQAGANGGNDIIGADSATLATISSNVNSMGFENFPLLTTGYELSGFGGRLGNKCTTCYQSTLIGYATGFTNFATGHGVLLIGSGGVAVDTPASSTSNYLSIENIWTVTGDNTPSTAVNTLNGLLDLPNLPADTGQSDASVCWVSSSTQLYYGTGTGGLCLTTSDARLKNNIHTEVSGLFGLMRLRTVSFNYRAGTGYDLHHTYEGWTAEEMAGVFPNLVGRDMKGVPNSIDMMGLMPIVVNSIKILEKEIIALAVGFLFLLAWSIDHHHRVVAMEVRLNQLETKGQSG